MSNLSEIEKRYLEKLLGMAGGYVLDFTNATFGDFFRHHGFDIHSEVYQTYGTSKAKKMRAFWDQEGDSTVATVLSDMIDIYETNCDLGDMTKDKKLLTRARFIVSVLSGESEDTGSKEICEISLRNEFSANLGNLPIAQEIVPIIERRLDEVDRTLRAGAYLSSIVMCGSILEAVLLGQAQRDPERFYKSKKAPKTAASKVKPFQAWTLANLIDVANELGFLKPDTQAFSHGLRDFRNYIHPNQQMQSGFTPDEHTAKMCVQVLRTALASVAGER